MSKLELRDYQCDLIEGVNQAFDSGARSILAVLPTGGGKTRVASNIACDYQRVLWVAHRNELIEQARFALDMAGHQNFVLSSIFVDPPDGEFDLLVVDEGHHVPANTFQRFIDKTKFNRLLALTATPYRLDRQGLNFDVILYGASLDNLVEQGHLVPVDLYTVRSRGSRDIALVNWMYANAAVLGKTIVFVRNLADAKFFKMALGLSFKADIVAGNSDRETQLAAFQSDGLDVLISCIVLTEGTDLPCTSTIIIARDTDSTGLLRQMIGRGLRLYPNKTHCNVVHNIDLKNKKAKSIAPIIKPRRHFISIDKGDSWYTTLME